MFAEANRSSDSCSWCGTEIGADDGFRAFEPEGARRAAFCRLEHVVPWAIRGPHWEVGDLDEPLDAASTDRCSHCDAELGDVRVLLIRHRGPHRVGDAFCSVDHLTDWAKAGGRWQ